MQSRNCLFYISHSTSRPTFSDLGKFSLAFPQADLTDDVHHLHAFDLATYSNHCPRLFHGKINTSGADNSPHYG
jgi:hypothetical protein